MPRRRQRVFGALAHEPHSRSRNAVRAQVLRRVLHRLRVLLDHRDRVTALRQREAEQAAAAVEVEHPQRGGAGGRRGQHLVEQHAPRHRRWSGRTPSGETRNAVPSRVSRTWPRPATTSVSRPTMNGPGRSCTLITNPSGASGPAMTARTGARRRLSLCVTTSIATAWRSSAVVRTMRCRTMPSSRGPAAGMPARSSASRTANAIRLPRALWTGHSVDGNEAVRLRGRSDPSRGRALAVPGRRRTRPCAGTPTATRRRGSRACRPSAGRRRGSRRAERPAGMLSRASCRNTSLRATRLAAAYGHVLRGSSRHSAEVPAISRDAVGIVVERPAASPDAIDKEMRSVYRRGSITSGRP